jgi:hypothetical protein
MADMHIKFGCAHDDELVFTRTHIPVAEFQTEENFVALIGALGK